MKEFEDFIVENGISLSAINSGSTEIALSADKAIEAINILADSDIIIYGGDILTKINEHLMYAYQVWGKKYHTLNWSCEAIKGETRDIYAKRSHILAINSINKALSTAKNMHMECYIAFVL